jgi:hypothetical protein
MTTWRQFQANRLNALKGTGRKTEEGKRISRRNALRHGLVAENYDQNAKNLICAGAPGYSLGVFPTIPNTPVQVSKKTRWAAVLHPRPICPLPS